MEKKDKAPQEVKSYTANSLTRILLDFQTNILPNAPRILRVGVFIIALLIVALAIVGALFFIKESLPSLLTNKKLNDKKSSQEGQKEGQKFMVEGKVEEVDEKSRLVKVKEDSTGTIYSIDVSRIDQIKIIPLPNSGTPAESIASGSTSVKNKVQTLSINSLKKNNQVQILAVENFFGKESFSAREIFILP
ncbi:MAG: hypothetical protein WD231_04815 [Candidatus Woykebacteria bacterium]